MAFVPNSYVPNSKKFPEAWLEMKKSVPSLYSLGMIVAYKNEKAANLKKVHHYELCIQQYGGTEDWQLINKEGNEEILPLPIINTLFRVRITKRDAKKLIDDGVRPGGAFFLEQSPQPKKW